MSRGTVPMHSQQPPGVVQNWSTLQCSKQNTEQCGYDHAPVTRGRMRAQFPLPHGLDLPAAPPTAAAARPNVHLQRDPGAPLGTSSSGEDSKTSVVAGMSTPPPSLPNTPPARASPPPSTIPRGCSLHANSTHEPTLLARADLRRRVPTPPP